MLARPHLASAFVIGIVLTACHPMYGHEASWAEHEEPLLDETVGTTLSNRGEVSSPSDGESLAVFHSALAPYGTWFDHAIYGEIWIPHAVGTGFVPYLTAGRWVYTPEGFSWNSQHAWGWATFHYGRWAQVGSLGGAESTWAWVPGTRWAPAWVDWRCGGGWVAWGPAAPSMGTRAGKNFSLPPIATTWVAVTAKDFLSEQLEAQVVRPPQTSRVVAETRALPVMATTTFRGPPPHMLGLSTEQLARSAAFAADRPSELPTRVVASGALIPRTTVVLRSQESAYDPPPPAAPATPATRPPPPSVAAGPTTVMVTPVVPFGYPVPYGVAHSPVPPAYGVPHHTGYPTVYGAPAHPAWSAFDASFAPRMATPMAMPPTHMGPSVTSAPPAYGGPTSRSAPPARAR